MHALEAELDDLRRRLAETELDDWKARIDQLEVQAHLGQMDADDQLQPLVDQMRNRLLDARAQFDKAGSAAGGRRRHRQRRRAQRRQGPRRRPGRSGRRLTPGSLTSTREHGPAPVPRPRTAPEDHPPMLSPSSIVVPLDGSDLSRTALPVGAQLARALGSSVVPAHVRVGQHRRGAAGQPRRPRRRRSTCPPRSASCPTRSPPPPSPTRCEGTDDAVVMATHGRCGLGKALLGSVAEDVLKATERPILLLGPSATAAPVHRRRHHARRHRRLGHLERDPPPRRPLGARRSGSPSASSR